MNLYNKVENCIANSDSHCSPEEMAEYELQESGRSMSTFYDSDHGLMLERQLGNLIHILPK
jgi:hypothetical protein